MGRRGGFVMDAATLEMVLTAYDETFKDAVAGGRAEDVANAVAFFADERSSYVNGQILYVSGGPAT